MLEDYTRCRYWPNCAIHLGRTAPVTFNDKEVSEIRTMWREGSKIEEIALEFRTSRKTIRLILNGVSHAVTS